MALTIPEQLTAAAITDALNGTREETIWAKLAWSTSRGTFSASGWNPPGYVKAEPIEGTGGTFFKTTKLVGGNAFVYFVLANNASLINGAEARTDGLWLFTTGEGTANGYQLLLKQASTGTTAPKKWIFILSKYVGGVQTKLTESAEVTVEEKGGFALGCVGGKLRMYRRELEASAWVEVGEAKEDSTFKEGFSAMQGNGSNPSFKNFATGTLEPEGRELVVPRVPHRGLIMSGRRGQ